MFEQIVAQVEFDFARDANHNPAGQELEDAFHSGDGQQQHGVGEEFLARHAEV